MKKTSGFFVIVVLWTSVIAVLAFFGGRELSQADVLVERVDRLLAMETELTELSDYPRPDFTLLEGVHATDLELAAAYKKLDKVWQLYKPNEPPPADAYKTEMLRRAGVLVPDQEGWLVHPMIYRRFKSLEEEQFE